MTSLVIFRVVCTCFAHKHRVLCSAILSASFNLQAFLYSALFLYTCFASKTSSLCSAILSASFNLHRRFVIFSIVLVCVLSCLTNVGIFCLTHAVMSYNMSYDHVGLLWDVDLSSGLHSLLSKDSAASCTSSTILYGEKEEDDRS